MISMAMFNFCQADANQTNFLLLFSDGSMLEDHHHQSIDFNFRFSSGQSVTANYLSSWTNWKIQMVLQLVNFFSSTGLAVPNKPEGFLNYCFMARRQL